MSLIEYNERIPSSRRRNQRLLSLYLSRAQGGGSAFHPLPPNPNVLMYLTPHYEEAVYADEPAAPRRILFDLLELTFAPSTVTVPNVTGMVLADALISLSNATLVGTISYVQNGFPYNTVVTQSISAGSQVGQGTVVQLQVDNETVVPSLIGLTVSAATTLLGSSVLGADPEPTISALTPGTVVNQNIGAGALVIANTVVTFFYAVRGDGFRVQAVTAGWYNGAFYNPGDTFDLLQAADFSDSTLNYEIDGAEYTAGWMVQVAQSTPVTQSDGNAVFPVPDPNRRFVE